MRMYFSSYEVFTVELDWVMAAPRQLLNELYIPSKGIFADAGGDM